MMNTEINALNYMKSGANLDKISTKTPQFFYKNSMIYAHIQYMYIVFGCVDFSFYLDIFSLDIFFVRYFI